MLRWTSSDGEMMTKVAFPIVSASDISLCHFNGLMCRCQPPGDTASTVTAPPESTVMLDASQ
jgi:hypothetical protein